MKVKAEGKTYGFPDDATQEEIAATLNRVVPPQAKPEAPVEGTDEQRREAMLERMGADMHFMEKSHEVAVDYAQKMLAPKNIRSTALKAASGLPAGLSLGMYKPGEGTFGAFGARTQIHQGLNTNKFYEDHPILGGNPDQSVIDDHGVEMATEFLAPMGVYGGIRKVAFGVLNKFVKGAELEGKALLAYKMAGEGTAGAIAGGLAADKPENVPMYAGFGATLGAGIPALSAWYGVLARKLEGRRVETDQELRQVMTEGLTEEAERMNRHLPVEEQITGHEISLGVHNVTDDLIADAGNIQTINEKITSMQDETARTAGEIKSKVQEDEVVSKLDKEVMDSAPDLDGEVVGELETMRRVVDPVGMSIKVSDEMITELTDIVDINARMAKGEPVEEIYNAAFVKLNEYLNTGRINSSRDWLRVTDAVMTHLDDSLKNVLDPQSHEMWKTKASELAGKFDDWNAMGLVKDKAKLMADMPEHALLFRSTIQDQSGRLHEMIMNSRANPNDVVARLQAKVQYQKLMEFSEMFLQVQAGAGRLLNSFNIEVAGKLPKTIYPNFDHLADEAPDVAGEILNQIEKNIGRKKVHAEVETATGNADKVVDDIKHAEGKESAKSAEAMAESADAAADKVIKERAPKVPKTFEEEVEAIATEGKKAGDKIQMDDLDHLIDQVPTDRHDVVTTRVKDAVARIRATELEIKAHIADLKDQTRPEVLLGKSERNKPEGVLTAADTALADAKKALAEIRSQGVAAKGLLKKILSDPDVRPLPSKAKGRDHTPDHPEVTAKIQEAVTSTANALRIAEARLATLESKLQKGEGFSEGGLNGPQTAAEAALQEARMNVSKTKAANKKILEAQRKLDENEKLYPVPEKSKIRKLKDQALLKMALHKMGGHKSIEAEFDDFLDTYQKGSTLKIKGKAAGSLFSAVVEGGRTAKLSNPLTHGVNFGSLVGRLGLDLYTDGVMYLGGMVTRNAKRVTFRELKYKEAARFKSMWTELTGEVVDPAKLGWDKLKNIPEYIKNTTPYDAMIDVLTVPEHLEEFLKRGLLDPYVATEGTHSKYIHQDFLKAKAGEMLGKKVQDMLDTPCLEIPWKILDAGGATARSASYGIMSRMDNLMGKQSYEAELQGELFGIMERHGKDQKWMEGMYDLIKQYRAGVAGGHEVNIRVSPQVAKLVKELDTKALKASEEARWMAKPDTDIGKKTLSVVSHPGVILATNLWFARTPAALLKWIHETNPVGTFLSGTARAKLFGKNGHREQMKQIAHVGFMTAMMKGTWELAQAGKLTGSILPTEYDVYRDAGMQPNSWNIGTDDEPKWMEFARADPFATVATVMTDLAHLNDNAKDMDVEGIFSSLLCTFISIPMDKTMVKGLSDTMKIFMDSDFKGERARQWMVNYGGGLMPLGSMAKEITSATDGLEFRVQVNNMWDKVRETYGMTDGMFIQRDTLGKPVPKNHKAFQLRVATQRMDSPIRQKMLALAMTTRDMPRELDNFEFNDNQLNAIGEIVGDKLNLEGQLNAMLKSDFVGLPDRELKKSITSFINDIRKEGMYQYLEQHPETMKEFEEFQESKEAFMSQSTGEVDTANPMALAGARTVLQKAFKKKADRPLIFPLKD